MSEAAIEMVPDYRDPDHESDITDYDGSEDKVRSSRVNSIASQAEINEQMQFTKFSPAEFCKYTLFLIVFTGVAMLGRGLGASNYNISHQISRALTDNFFVPAAPFEITQGEKSLMDIDQYYEIYDWLSSVGIPILLPELDAAGQPIVNDSERHLVAGQSKILGAIRLRQLRVLEKPCLHVSLDDWTCYPAWSSSDESTDDFIGIPWRSAKELDETVTWWGVRESYGGSGFALDLPLDRTNATAEIERLKNNNFIDRATRWIVSDFVLYNPTLSLHCIGRISFELPPSGGVEPSFEVKTWNFYRYDGRRGQALIAFEVVFLLFVIYFTFEEAYELWTKGWPGYKADKWNIVDVVNLVFFYITIGWRFRGISTLKDTELLPSSTSTFTNYRGLAKSIEYECYMQMVNGFLLYLKMFKYMTFSRRIKFLFAMFKRSANDLFIFCIVLSVVFAAFGMVGFLAFSTDVHDFRSLPHAMVNLVRFTIAEPPYDELRNSNKALGSLYFVVWGLVMLLILANVFIAILCDAYADVIGEMEEDDTPSLLKMFEGLIRRIRNFRKLDVDHDGQLSEGEIAEAMHVSKNQAHDIIEQYDVNHDGKLDQSEYTEMIKDKERRESRSRKMAHSRKEKKSRSQAQSAQSAQSVQTAELIDEVADDLNEEEKRTLERIQSMESMLHEYTNQMDQQPQNAQQIEEEKHDFRD